MTPIAIAFPQPPDFRVDWAAISTLPWIQRLAGCPQDPRYHAEGDVFIHTRWVCEVLSTLPDFRALTGTDREVLFAAALLHDVAKPECTKIEEHGITSRGHSRRGAIVSRCLLWRLGFPAQQREHVAALVRFHQVPFFLLEREDPRRLAFEISQSVRCDLLAILAEADARGRKCADAQRLFDNIALFRELCREESCLSHAKAFPSDHSRFVYFRDSRRDPASLTYDDTYGEVVLLSGLPGSGKDTWRTTHFPDGPVVSLDALRQELDIAPTDGQGGVIAAAEARAREHLRRKLPFVFNATNLSRQIRRRWIDRFAAYHARVRIVYVEVPEAVLKPQNQRRARSVPADVIESLLDRWEVPDLTEAHQVEWAVREYESPA